MIILISNSFTRARSYAKENELKDFKILGDARGLHGLWDFEIIWFAGWHYRNDKEEIEHILHHHRALNRITKETRVR